MIRVLVGIAYNKKANESARRAAAAEVLDRAIGKPAQMIVGDEDGGPVQIAYEDKTARLELARRMAYLLSQADTGHLKAISGGTLDLEPVEGDKMPSQAQHEEQTGNAST